MTFVYCFANHKGGTGKSTTTLNVGAGLSKMKKKVLLIDLDPQTNLTIMLGIYNRPSNTLYEIFAEDCDIKDAIIKIDKHIDLIPSSLDSSGIELEISSNIGRESKLKQLISSITPNYDFVLIDAPPSMSLLTINALVAANKVFIPVQTEFIALNGLAKFVDIISKIKTLNTKLDIGGIIATRYDSRKILNRGVVDKIKEHFPNNFLKSIIRENIAIAESISQGLNIFDYAPKSNGALDYLSLTKEIVKLSKI